MDTKRVDFSLDNKKVWIAGHNGMVGQALSRRLSTEMCDVLCVSRADLDLREQSGVKNWMMKHKPDVVILAAAKVGGIIANSENPAEFFYDNIAIATNVIHSAYETGVEKLLFLGSSCIYPRECVQPIKEEALLSAALEPTNEGYALAKIGGLKMAQYYRSQYDCDFISAMPCNLFGVGDTYHEQHSHVIPAMIMKAHAAKEQGDKAITFWGTGSPTREFLDVDSLADALVFLLQKYSDDMHINVGAGQDITIRTLARIVCEQVGYGGDVLFDESKPDGTPKKCLDVSRLETLGWETVLCDRTAESYKKYLETNIKNAYLDFKSKL